MDEKTWVDFKAVKSAVKLGMVLDHYGVNWLRKSGEELRGRCPIHKGDGERTFHANSCKNAFKCFSCGAKGNVLDFVAAMESCSVRDAALKLAEWFSITATGDAKPEAPARPGQGSAACGKSDGATIPAAPVVINPPLPFQLRLDPAHEYGVRRGLTAETIAYFGCGFCLSRGTFAGRYLVPLHDPRGQLVGYAGRAIDEREPKYLFPSGEKGFHKRYLLFNLHRLSKQVSADDPVVVVEGFFDCMKVHQAGFPCVALMGASLSTEQEALLVADCNRVVLFLDGDEAGAAAAETISNRLKHQTFVKVLDVGPGRQPDQLTTEELSALIRG